MKSTLLLILFLVIPVFSCEQAVDPAQPVELEEPVEPVLAVTCDESGTEYEIYQFMRSASHTAFARLLADKGYDVYFDDAVHFVGIDRETGHKGHMTLIPCAVPGDDSRIAMIQYFRGNGRYASTAAEYFKTKITESPIPSMSLPFCLMRPKIRLLTSSIFSSAAKRARGTGAAWQTGLSPVARVALPSAT